MTMQGNVNDLFNAMWPFIADRLQSTLVQAGSSALASPPAAAGAPASAQYLTLANDATLSAERVATAGNLITLTDAGANSTLTLAVDSTRLTISAGKLDKTGAGTLTLNAGGAYTLDAMASGTIALGAGTLSVGSVNLFSTSAHTHAITSSSNPGAAASLLASDASGYLSLVRLTLSDRLRSPLIDTAAGALTLSPAGDVVLNPGSGLVKLASGDSFQSDNYASQTTGMRVTHLGEGDFRYLFADELHAKSFIADLEQALAGGQIIAKSVAMLYANFTMPAAGSSGTFIVRDLPSATGMRVFEERDIVRCRSFSRSGGSLSITDAWGEVALDTSYGVSGFDSSTRTQRYTYLRRQSVTIDDQNNDPITDQTSDPIVSSNISVPEGAMAGGTVIQADAVVLDYGKNQSGIHEVNAIDGLYGLNSPYAQTVSWSVHPKNATVRTRIGNLRGVFGVADEYGLYAGNGTSSADSYIRASTAGVLLNNVPLALYSGGTQRVNIDAAGTNVWFSPDGGATRTLAWDGSALTLRNATLSLIGSGTLTLSSTGLSGLDPSSKPTFSFANASLTVNGEAMTAGDVLIGDNSASKPNIFFDQSAGLLYLRGGLTNQAFLDTTGALVTGTTTPYVRYASNGVTCVIGASDTGDISTTNGIFFANDASRSTIYGSLRATRVSSALFMTLESTATLRLNTNTDYIRLGELSTLTIMAGSGRTITLDTNEVTTANRINFAKSATAQQNFTVNGLLSCNNWGLGTYTAITSTHIGYIICTVNGVTRRLMVCT